MRIVESNVALAAQRQYQREQSESLSIRYEPPRRAANNDRVEISSAAQMLEEQEEAVNNDPKLLMIKNLLEAILGREIKLTYLNQEHNQQDVQSNTPTQNEGGLVLEYHASENEAEQMQFAGAGIIKTADGREIEFSAQLELNRSYRQQIDVTIATSSAARPKKDPLILNYAASAVTLAEQTFQFDIDGKGQAETIHQLNAGSAYLAHDKNRDGKINNGRELFGTQSGDGFADLAHYDQDQNGWIDEGDQIFGELKLWIKDASGNDQLQTLAQMKIGAIFLGRAKADFDLNNAHNQNYGQIRSAGLFLFETGAVGTAQQLDLSV
ncbi:hypothetical protein NT239_15960 [Chitinibacter sp. SCUT-21]|uniref:hypothetical protein n=1 Tax=Chitinibacter sp. SCUT-21 TaxID=2970891 RepID=UPI0035A6CBAF